MDTTLFNVNLPTIPAGNSKTLILSGCRVVLHEGIAYSEMDKINYYSLNCNDYESGRADIELSFENGFRNPYFKFFVQCVSIRTDSEVLCKINYNQTKKYVNTSNYSKITKEGKVAMGLSYYFKTADERALLMQCQSFCIEGFIALKKETNVYGFMCRIEQADNGWKMTEGNTYQIYKRVNIRSFYH